MKRSSMKTWHLLLSTAVFSIIFIFYQGLFRNPSYIPPVIINTMAPDIVATELYEGREIRLSDFKGKVVVLNFWASWCQECVLEHSNLLRLRERYKENPLFVMIGVNYQDKEDLAKAYLKKYGNNFTHVRDASGKISIDYGIYGVPETLVVDQKGMIRYKSIGPLVRETYVHLIDDIIEPLLNDLPLKQGNDV